MDIIKQYGAVAILDALGASSYSDAEVKQFLRSRERVFSKLGEYLEDKTAITLDQLKTFTFNDTIVIALLCGQTPPTLKAVGSFSAVLRKFLVDSMANGLLFRGAAALGQFRADDETNTIMGEAVTDAAQWYEETDWIGVHFTPRSFLEIERLMLNADDRKEWALFPYDVPLKNGSTLNTFAINWPKVFLVGSQRPWSGNPPPKQKLLELLSGHRVPRGTEQKYFSTLAFFDRSMKLNRPSNKKKTSKKATKK